MATFTPKLNLEKPLGTEFYNVTGVQNVNSDKIDSFAIEIDNSKFENVGIIIPKGANLNTYRTCGHYRCPADVSAATIINAPFGASAFSMIVEGSSGNNQLYHTQTAINHATTQTKIRATSDAGATWSAWIHVLTEAETVNNLISTSATLPLSAGQGKILQDTKANGTTQVIAGNGLTGGGDLTSNKTLNVVSANDGIITNADNIQLDTQNILTSTSATKPLSANMGKVLQDTKLNLTGGTLTGALKAPTIVASNETNTAAIYARFNNLETDQVYLYNNSTKTGIYSLMPTHGELDIISRNKSTGVVTYAGGNYGTINGSTATFSGNVTAPSITIGGYVVTIV